MAKISIQTAQPRGLPSDDWNLGPYRFFKQGGEHARRHALVEDPAEADFILFADSGVGPHFESIRKHPIYKEWKQKSLVFCRDDYPVPIIPGLYASVQRKWHNPDWARTGFFVHDTWVGALEELDHSARRRYLYNFCGSCSNHSVRLRIRRKSGSNPIFDTSGMVIPAYTTGNSFIIDALREAFVAYSLESSFVLCPRGRGCGSIRLFEVMEVGRVPVIISDDWVPPLGIDWDSFSIRIAEQDIDQLEEILEGYLPRLHEMEVTARRVWESHFSIHGAFDYVGDQLVELAKSGMSSMVSNQLRQVPRLASPFQVGKYARAKLKSRRPRLEK